MQYIVQKRGYRVFPLIALAVFALLLGIMNAGAVHNPGPSAFIELGGNGGDKNIRADNVTPGLDWANGPSPACSHPATGTQTCPGSGGLFDGGVFVNSTTPPTAPAVTANGTVGTNFIDAIAFGVDPLAADVGACSAGAGPSSPPCTAPQVACSKGDPTVYTGQGGEKNGDSMVVDATGSRAPETYALGSVPPKDDVQNVYAVSRSGFPSTNHDGSVTSDGKEVFFGGERFFASGQGDTHFDFEFLQSTVDLTIGNAAKPCNGGKFDGGRVHGDFVASIDYTTGGTLGTFALSQWHCNVDITSADNTGWQTDPAANPASLTGTKCDFAAGEAGSDSGVRFGTGPHYQEIACIDVQLPDDCPGISGVNPDVAQAIRAVTNDPPPNGPGAVECGGWACRGADGGLITTVDANRFFEGGVNLKTLGFTRCLSTFIPHTRSSQSFTATLKDFEIIPFNTCTGAIRIEKVDESGPPPVHLLGACFSVNPGALSVCDNNPASPPVTTNATDKDNRAGFICLDGLGSGGYTVTETVVPTGYIGDPGTPTATVPSGLTDNVVCPNGPTGSAVVTFVNKLGSIQWEKRSDITGNLQGGAQFSISGDPFGCHQPPVANPGTFTDNSSPDADPHAGQVLINNVCLGTYTVTEETAPTGFAKDTDPTRSVTVSAAEPNPVIGSTLVNPPAGDTTGRDDCPDGGNVDTDESDFCNLVGSLIIRKEAKDASTAATNDLLPGACFTITPDPATGSGSKSICDGGTGDQYGAGLICLNGVIFTTYSISENATPPPAHYVHDPADPNPKSFAVNSSSTCAGRAATPQSNTAGDVTFQNLPLSRFEVKFICLALSPSGSGQCATQAQIVCDVPAINGGAADTDPAEDGLADNSGPGGTPVFDDKDEYYGDDLTSLVPGAYNCQINIDP